MLDEKIASIEVSIVRDDPTGIYQIGELDFGVNGWVRDWLKNNSEDRERLALWLEWMGGQCRKKQPPFEDWPPVNDSVKSS